MTEHKCTGSVTREHEFNERGVCRFCAIPFEEIRQFLPSRTAGAPNYDPEATEQAIRGFFTRESDK